MSENQIEYLNIEEVKPEGTLKKSVRYKPYKACIIIAICAAACFITRNTLLMLFGIFLVAVAGAVFFLQPDRKTVDVYDQGVLVYGVQDDTTGIFIRYEDIEEWTTKQMGRSDVIYLKLTDGREIYKESWQASKAHWAIYPYAGKKESKALRAKEKSDQPLKLNNPFKTWFKKKEEE